MSIEIKKAAIPRNVTDTRQGRVKYPFRDLPVVDLACNKPVECLVVEGERESELALIRMRGVARDNKFRFVAERIRDNRGKLQSVRIWRTG